MLMGRGKYFRFVQKSKAFYRYVQQEKSQVYSHLFPAEQTPGKSGVSLWDKR